MKNIKVEDTVWEKLWQLKLKNKKETLNDVIDELVKKR